MTRWPFKIKRTWCPFNWIQLSPNIETTSLPRTSERNIGPVVKRCFNFSFICDFASDLSWGWYVTNNRTLFSTFVLGETLWAENLILLVLVCNFASEFLWVFHLRKPWFHFTNMFIKIFFFWAYTTQCQNLAVNNKFLCVLGVKKYSENTDAYQLI